MSFSPLSFSRRHLLGDLYSRCEPLAESVPVYLLGEENELLGHADQSLGEYADAISFHLADDVCKRMSAGQFTCEFDVAPVAGKGRLAIQTIFLRARKPYIKPAPAD